MKEKKKLSLNKQTVRNLSSEELEGVSGGTNISIFCTIYGATCDCTGVNCDTRDYKTATMSGCATAAQCVQPK